MRNANLCPTCRYDLTGLPRPHHCPESRLKGAIRPNWVEVLITALGLVMKTLQAGLLILPQRGNADTAQSKGVPLPGVSDAVL